MDFPGHFQHIFQQLNVQRLHAQLCDCVVVVGGQRFQAHRSILAACSSHFRALLSSNDSSDEVAGAGGDQGGGPSVMALDPEVVTPESFSTLLDMIYTSTLSLGASNVMDVLLAASHLHLNAVVKACKLHLSRKNFPASPPKGWRSMQQQKQCPSTSPHTQQQTSSTSVMEEDLEGVEVSQSGGVEVDEVSWKVNGEQRAAPSMGHKRKSNEERLSGRKRSFKERSPTVTGSTVSSEEPGEELLSADYLKTADNLWGRKGEDEVEEKYEATKGEEIQLPSQSDSITAGAWEKDGDTVVKVKVGDEGEEEEEEPKMAMIEVKMENLSSYSQEVNNLPNVSPSSTPQDSIHHLVINGEHTAPAGPTGDVRCLQSQLCSDLPDREVGDAGEESVDDDGLEGLSELAFSCFLNPSNESGIGVSEEEDSLANLTAAAAASDAAAAAGDAGPLCQNEDAIPSSGESLDSSSSLVFPVTSVPLQQILPSQGPGFSDTLILQPTQNSIPGFFSGIRPGISLEASLFQPSRARKSKGSGGTTFRRIAPKVHPGSEEDPSPSSSGSTGDASDRPPLTRASEDVLSKCKKAAAEDHVLLVEGEKKYACKICFKTFMNLTDCKKHIRVHTGEKPYPCPKCGKCFSQSSHLYKHSKNATCLNWKDYQSFPDTLHWYDGSFFTELDNRLPKTAV